MKNFIKNNKEFLIFLLLFIIFTILFIEQGPLNSDAAGYYSYLRSLFFDKDLLFVNEYEKLSDTSYLCYTTPCGYLGSACTYGATLLWLPFFLLAHVLAIIYNLFGASILLDGYSDIYIITLKAGTIFYGFLGLWLVYLICCDYFRKKIAFLASICILLLTPYFWYMFKEPFWPHVLTGFTTALFIYIWHRTKNNRTYIQWISLGITIGISAMIRPENIILLVIPLIEMIYKITHKKKISILKIIIFFLFFLFSFIPQLMVWIILKDNPLSIPSNESFLLLPGETSLHLLKPALFQTLFSSYHGLIIWSPIFILIIIGFFYLYKKDQVIGLIISVLFLSELYLNSILYDWWAGVSFGARRFVDIIPVFILPLAALFNKIKKEYFLCLIFPFVIWNFLLFIQASTKTDLWFYISFNDIIQGAIHSIKNLPLILTENTFINRISLSLFLKTILPLLMIISCLWYFINNILVHKKYSNKFNYRNIVYTFIVINLFHIAYLYHAKKTSDISKLKYKQELVKYSNKKLYSKAKFMFGTTYLENASYYIETRNEKKAIKE